MYRWLGCFATRRPRCVLLAALGFLVLSLVVGSSATGRLKTQGYDDPASDSSFVARVTAPYQGTSANLVVVVRVGHGGVDDPAARTEGRVLTRRLAAQPYVGDVSSYWSGGPAELRGRDGRSALLIAHVDGDGEQIGPRAERVRAALSGRSGRSDRSGVTVHVGGTALADQEMHDLAASDLRRAEAVVLPGTLLLLVLVFGSVMAAVLPLLIGVLAIGGTLLALSLLGGVTDVSVFALNLTTALGLGLGIDYGLLIVSRFREELTAGHESREAARRTARAAGHTIFFSAATVCAALAALLLFPPYFLRSFAYAGIAVVAVAAVAAVTVLPALLALLGRRVNAWAVPWRRRTRAGSASRFWERLARCVVRHPVLAALPVLALLATLAAPFTHAGFATPDDRALPRTTSSRQAGDLLRGHFDRGSADALTVVFTSPTPQTARDYAPELSALPGVAEVVGPSGVWRHGIRVAPAGSAATHLLPSGPDAPALFSVVPSADPHSHAAQRLVRTVRGTPTPPDTEIHVGGPSAALVDAKDTIAGRLPVAAAVIAGSTFLLLFLFSRSLLLPLKAIALNCLSLAAVLGAMVWVFQSGHLRTLLGFTPGPLSTTMPVLLFCVVFGLSVDYEVFVLARIKEAHDAGQDTADAIVNGVARTGGIVTTAGALLAFTLLAFGTSQVALLQFFGIGAGLGVLLDASLVRGVLVPAFMRLAGGLNWWAPWPFAGRTRTGRPSGGRALSGPAQPPPPPARARRHDTGTPAARTRPPPPSPP
ncbi:membrane protein [Streptomyces lucensis JCM 4490]|uniref:Membrane protein n=1 Tax=Streptomyces lucensis JCM 4490 TaxID=1306176 RepID=A0A918MT73_9ACTN|nr:MMPL family transporter [Streptomyces lucensis]GGW55974.1 membrane protein [Streptomyces lucensis JCM 4490]